MCFEAKSPKSPRKFDFPTEQRGSPKFDYSIDDSDGIGSGNSSAGCSRKTNKPPKLNRNFSKASSGSGGNGSGNNSAGASLGYYSEERSPKYYEKSPSSPRKFNYDSISPKYETGK